MFVCFPYLVFVPGLHSFDTARILVPLITLLTIWVIIQSEKLKDKQQSHGTETESKSKIENLKEIMGNLKGMKIMGNEMKLWRSCTNRVKYLLTHSWGVHVVYRYCAMIGQHNLIEFHSVVIIDVFRTHFCMFAKIKVQP